LRRRQPWQNYGESEREEKNPTPPRASFDIHARELSRKRAFNELRKNRHNCFWTEGCSEKGVHKWGKWGEAMASGVAMLSLCALGVFDAAADPPPKKAPTITAHPQSVTVAAGATVTLSVSATGEAPLSYRWISGGDVMTGATNAVLTISNASRCDAGTYKAIVFNPYGFVISKPATVTVEMPSLPIITNQPLSQTVSAGSTVTLSVGYSGTGPFYFQWRRNGINLANATNSALTLVNIQSTDAADYSVVVFTDAGGTLSNPASVRVTNATLQFTDAFASMVNLPSSSGSGSASNSGATIESGEPEHANKSAGQSVWISWQPGASGIATISLAGSSFDTLLAVYTGSAVNALTPVASDDDSGGYFASAIRFNVTAGTRYRIAVAGLGTENGDFNFQWSLTPTTSQVPVITVQPASQTVALGGVATFSLQTTPANVSVQWFLDGQLLAGATNKTLSIPNVDSSRVGSYSARVTSGSQSAMSIAAALQINNSEGVVEPVLSSDKLADALRLEHPIRLGSATFAATTTSGPRAMSTGIARGYTGTQIFSTTGGLSDPSEPLHCGIQGGSSHWFALIAEGDGELHVSTDGSSFDTILAVYLPNGSGFENLQVVGCDNNSGLDGLDSRVSVPVQRHLTYVIVVDGVNGASGQVVLNYSLATPASLRVLSSTAEGTLVRVTGQRNGIFVIESSASGSSWTSIVTNQSSLGTFQYLDTRNAPGCFYRARTLHP